MIRVNLLPVRQLEAEAVRRRELKIGAGILGVSVLLLLSGYFYQFHRLSKLAGELAGLRSEVQVLNAKVKEVGDLHGKIKEFQSKRKIIEDLNERKVGPVRVMESLSAATPARLWLTEFKEIGGRLTINGAAADNQTVAEFLKALASSAYFSDVELVETAQGGQERGPFNRFSIKSVVSYIPAAIPPAGGKNPQGSPQ